jgi:hypothetical protein
LIQSTLIDVNCQQTFKWPICIAAASDLQNSTLVRHPGKTFIFSKISGTGKQNEVYI